MMFTWIVRGENVENSAKVSVYCVVLYLYLYSNEILIEQNSYLIKEIGRISIRLPTL